MQEKFQDLPLEEVMGDRFGRYSKYIIQERALPDARDGLKPVQRRILYAMHTEGNTQDKPFRKSAKTVGNVIGNYHPHGDRSVYEAMVRMSQDWKARHMLIEMHGNNGSVDGDPAAAMRYTEARLSAIAGELLRDITKDTVDVVPNFDDQDTEPTVLPARFPNLLVNGSTGISAGYATDIPPHNLFEAIEAVLMRLDNPKATVDELMTVIKGPDFPTGGIIQGTDGIKKAYETGRGKIVVRAKTAIEQLKGGKEQIVVTELPYDVNKANLVKRIDEQRLDKKLDGIAEIRDESDRTGLRVVIELKKDIPAQGILNYLLKITDLQVTYNFNMIAIHHRRPTMMTLPLLLDAYIEHQKEVVKRRATFDLARANKRMHLVEGLIKALSILDKVIAKIRASKDKRDARQGIMDAFDFSEAQAEAIVSLQLYRLTNTDITELRAEHEALQKEITLLEGILQSPAKLIAVIRRELKATQKQFAEPRRSLLQAKIEELEVTLDVLVPSEEVIVSVTKDGYIKRTSPRSYSASSGKDLAMKESDYALFEQPMNTQHHLLLFTNRGQYIYQPVHELPDIRWKDLGQHISSIVPLEAEEEIIAVHGFASMDSTTDFVMTVTEAGQVKRTVVADYKVSRYSRALKTMNVKKEDAMMAAFIVKDKDEVTLVTTEGQALRFRVDEVPPTGLRTGGVKGMTLKDERVIWADTVDANERLIIVTQRGAVKKMGIEEVPTSNRAKRGVQILSILKSNPHQIVAVEKDRKEALLVIETEKHQEEIAMGDLPKNDRLSNGSFKVDPKTDGAIRAVYHKMP
ncbi:DNA topoisomerase 4 subunit A [Metalysinibacillus saudimassiliensis]|uniref:DNA topoisomerase 4 subunit A n=1 Tax=Metalysinibacillus saudimassiliensis TaxID=1461583 RepID=A0A078M3E2_9BACL|nr:DNA topoisomerase 4 subunit A [Metalysinibacillus saudimassiliensis]